MRKHLALLAALSLLAAPLPSAAGTAPPKTTTPPKTAAPPASNKNPEGENMLQKEEPAPKLEWLAFDAATARALAQKKHLLVDIYTTWCGWCRIMEKETYGDPNVAAYLRDNFVLAKVNGESTAKLKWLGKDLTERQFARAVGVTGYPATYFMKPNAEMLGGVGGFLRAPEFMIYAHYVGTRWYEKGKIGAYMDSLRNAALQEPQPKL